MLFESQYNELFLAVDTLAERLRALGEKAPASFTEFKKLATVSDGDSSLDENRMVRDLYIANQQVGHLVKKAIAIGEKADDVSTVDLLTQRVTAHDKAAWMLKSALPKEERLKLAS
ncbi:MAG: DNA starvation/stationary phase protection protein [Alphaproteobacteria bacterium]